MELNYFKDQVFDLLNDADIKIRDIETNDKENLFTVLLQNGIIFELECRQVEV
ncbi:MAG: hypothetical protein HFJ09_07665 [Lachnospiraceae bacterium]|nr:hypothetical protein [Lachnospiraceae bacterium]